MATHEVRVDYSKALAEEPETGHNRWHPDIPPAVTCDSGEEVVLETRDAFDGQMGPHATLETGAGPDREGGHALAARARAPRGAPRAVCPAPSTARWGTGGGAAPSEDLPGLPIPGSPCMGAIGLA